MLRRTQGSTGNSWPAGAADQFESLRMCHSQTPKCRSYPGDTTFGHSGAAPSNVQRTKQCWDFTPTGLVTESASDTCLQNCCSLSEPQCPLSNAAVTGYWVVFLPSFLPNKMPVNDEVFPVWKSSIYLQGLPRNSPGPGKWILLIFKKELREPFFFFNEVLPRRERS